MNNIIKRKWNINGMVQIDDLRGMTFQDEALAHTFAISGVDDAGNAVQIAGTVGAVFLRADNTDVAIIGSVSDGIAYVTLPAECYDFPGRFGLTVYLINDTQKTAIYAAIGTVTTTSSGNVSPETSEDVADLIAEIEAAVATIPADYSTLWTTFAPAYSPTSSYSVGQYVTYNGDLYKCVSYISGGESWNSAHWKKWKVSYDLANAIHDFNVLTGNRFMEWEYGKIIQTNGDTVDITTKNNQSTMANCVVECSPGDKFVICGSGASASRLWCFIDNSGNALDKAASSVTESGRVLTAPADSKYLVCNIFIERPHALYYGDTIANEETFYKTEISNIKAYNRRYGFTSYTEGSEGYGVSNFVYPPEEGKTMFAALRSAEGDAFYFDSSNNQLRSQPLEAHTVTELIIPENTYRFFLRIKPTDGSSFNETYLINNSYTLTDTELFKNIQNLADYNNKVFFTGFTEGSGGAGVSNWIYPTAEDVSFYAVTGAVYGNAYFYDVTGTQISNIELGANRTTKLEIPEGTRRFMLRLLNSDGSAFSENKLLKNSYLLVNNKLFDAVMNSAENSQETHDVYLLKDNPKHRVIVDANGGGDYTTIHAAWAAITDSSFTNQYEIFVMPGTYTENNITPPPYSHTHGIVPDSVLITSYGGDTTKSVIDVKAPCKLSNMNIISYTKYCIHYDSSLNAGGMLVCENMKLTQTGTGNGVCAGGGAFPNGTVYLWKSCSFIGGPAHCHTSGQFNDWDNTHDIFENCKADPFYGYLVQSVGGYGHNVFEVNGSEFPGNYGRGIRIDANNQRNSDKPWTFLAEPNEWQITGHGNKNTLVTFNGSGEGLMFETASVNQTIEVSGTAVPALFGIVKYRQGGARLKGKAYGIYLVKDAQTPNGTDVYQMWKRLGDCSSTNKTLTVKVGSTTQTYTFNQNYLSSKPSESTIIAAVNAVITAAVLKKNVITEFWTGVNLMEKQNTIVRSDCIAKGYFVGPDGRYCSENAASSAVWGIALEDGVQGETITVWTGDYMVTTLADGQYGVGQYGAPDSSVSNKVISVSSGVITRL